MEVHGQSGQTVFRTDTVHDLRITVAEPQWFATLSSWHSGGVDSVLPASILFDGALLDSVGLQMRGTSTFQAAALKKPLKLDFNAIVNGQTYDGLRSVNLNNDAGDASHLRNALTMGIMNAAGVNAPRTGYAQVFINDTCYGLYTLVEQINKAFTNERFGADTGDLWKSIWCPWEYTWPDPIFYLPQLELKNSPNDSIAYARLIAVFERIAHTPDEDLDDTLGLHLSQADHLGTMAVNAAVNAYDNGMHNWWLYHDPLTGVFRYLPWDNDLSFHNPGAVSFALDTTEINYWGATALSKAVTRNDTLVARFKDRLCALRATLFTSSYLAPRIDSA